LGILDAPSNTSDAACCLHCIEPLLLLWLDPAGWGLDLNAGEHRHLLTHHLWGDRHGAPAKQITRAFAANAKLNPSTSARVGQSTNVIAKKPG
jgi:hypothetical protein